MNTQKVGATPLLELRGWEGVRYVRIADPVMAVPKRRASVMPFGPAAQARRIAQTKADVSRGPRAQRRREPQPADVPTARRIDPASRAAFAKSDGAASRTRPNAIFRLWSGAGRERDGTFRAEVPLGRCGAHADRQHMARHSIRCGGKAKALK